MFENQKYILVLWGDNFQAVPAALFVTRLRAAGFTVKLVGISGAKNAGTHGLVLQPDITLGQALLLARKTICVIIPGGEQYTFHLEHDPRIQQLFEQAGANEAHFVIPELGLSPASVSIILSQMLILNALSVYSTDDCLFEFVEALIDRLLEMPDREI